MCNQSGSDRAANAILLGSKDEYLQRKVKESTTEYAFQRPSTTEYSFQQSLFHASNCTLQYHVSNILIFQ